MNFRGQEQPKNQKFLSTNLQLIYGHTKIQKTHLQFVAPNPIIHEFIIPVASLSIHFHFFQLKKETHSVSATACVENGGRIGDENAIQRFFSPLQLKWVFEEASAARISLYATS